MKSSVFSAFKNNDLHFILGPIFIELQSVRKNKFSQTIGQNVLRNKNVKFLDIFIVFLFQTLHSGRTRFHAKQHFRKVDMEVNQTATTRKNRHGGGGRWGEKCSLRMRACPRRTGERRRKMAVDEKTPPTQLLNCPLTTPSSLQRASSRTSL